MAEVAAFHQGVSQHGHFHSVTLNVGEADSGDRFTAVWPACGIVTSFLDDVASSATAKSGASFVTAKRSSRLTADARWGSCRVFCDGNECWPVDGRCPLGVL